MLTHHDRTVKEIATLRRKLEAVKKQRDTLYSLFMTTIQENTKLRDLLWQVLYPERTENQGIRESMIPIEIPITRKEQDGDVSKCVPAQKTDEAACLWKLRDRENGNGFAIP